MNEIPMMMCGHAANSKMKTEAGDIPCCVICGNTQISSTPIDLSTRQARCSSCAGVGPSSNALPFFEYTGEGSRRATENCTCGMHAVVHQEINPSTKRPGVTDHEFTARGALEFDTFYCGCRGWD